MYAAAVVKSMDPGDAFMLIGIAGNAGGPEDVRIEMTPLEPSPLMALLQRQQLVRRVIALTARPTEADDRYARFRDISGALCHAATVANVTEGYFRTVLLIFSNMVETPRLPRPDIALKRGLIFPEGTEAHVFYLDGAELASIGRASLYVSEERLVETWLSVFVAARVKIKRENFARPAYVDALFHDPIPRR
jgi:hypothetical protein